MINIENIQKTIDEFRKLPVIEREKTVFDIGTRGHFENPTTEVLAFFCNGSEVHNMGNLVIDSLVTLLNRKADKSLSMPCIPTFAEREVETKNKKRIDLLLNSDAHIIVIEAKIGHDQVNPFEEYETFADNLASEQDKEAVYVVLSPQGTIDDAEKNRNWTGISYNEISEAIRVNLQQYFFDKPFNKWLLILKDFLLHLESLMPINEHDDLHSEFALSNLSTINNAWQLVINSLISINQQVAEKLPTVEIYKHSWFGVPSFKCQFPNSDCEIILFATPDEIDANTSGKNQANIGKYLFIQVHVAVNQSDSLYQQLTVRLEDKIINSWSDKNLGYFRWPLTDLSSKHIVNEISSLLELFNELETKSQNKL